MLKHILTSTALLSLASGTVLADDKGDAPVMVYHVMGYTVLVGPLTPDTAASAKLASSCTTQSEAAQAIPAKRREPGFDVVRQSFERAGIAAEGLPDACD